MAKSNQSVTYAGPKGAWGRNVNALKNRKPINALLQDFIDAATFYRVAHVLQPMPLVLGLKVASIDKREMVYRERAMQILIAGGKLERLALQLEVLRAERDAFLTMREVTA